MAARDGSGARHPSTAEVGAVATPTELAQPPSARSRWMVAPARELVLFDDPLRSSRQEFFVHGDRIYYTCGELEGDLWVMDLIW